MFLQYTDSLSEGQSLVFLRNFENLQRFFTGEPWPWRSETWCPQGVFGGKLSFKKMSAGGRLCTLQETPHFLGPDDQS